MTDNALLLLIAGTAFSALSAAVGSMALHILARLEQTMDDHERRIKVLELR